MKLQAAIALLVSGLIGFTPSRPVCGQSATTRNQETSPGGDLESWVSSIVSPKKHKKHHHVAAQTDTATAKPPPLAEPEPTAALSPSLASERSSHRKVTQHTTASAPIPAPTPIIAQPTPALRVSTKKSHVTARKDNATAEPSPATQQDPPAPPFPSPASGRPIPKRVTPGADASDPVLEPSPGIAQPAPTPGVNASVATGEISEFSTQPSRVRKLIESSLELARQNIVYAYGSADPANGLDCSGFIYYTLRQNGHSEVPRDSCEQYVWARKAGTFRAVVSQSSDSFELDELRPGDLLFWVGTYATDHDPPVSHTMIYLGTETSTGHRLMIGSSNGRSYHGKKRNGVSVFDFTIPRSEKVPADGAPFVTTTSKTNSRFIGYARIPDM